MFGLPCRSTSGNQRPIAPPSNAWTRPASPEPSCGARPPIARITPKRRDCPTTSGAIPPCVPWPAACVTKAAHLSMADISHYWTDADHPHFRPYSALRYAFGVEEFAHVISSTPRPPLSRQPPLTGPASPQKHAAPKGRLS